MGGLAVEPVPTPPPTDDGTMGDGSVLLMLGNAQADKTLEELNPAEETTETGTSPAPSGSTDPAATTTTTTTPE
jgi:hypothetical protein